YADNQPIFSGVSLYTRRGDFQLDKNGYLVNGAGNYLMGLPVDPTSGNPVGSVPALLQFSNSLIPAQTTTQIQYQANLPSSPATANASAAVAGSELINPALFQASPLAGAPQPAKIIGINAALSADKKAVGVGTTVGLTANTTLASIGFTLGDVLTVSDGTNQSQYTVGAGAKISNLITGLSNVGGGAAVTVSLTPGGALQVQSNNFLDTVTLSDSAATAGADFAALGFGASSLSLTPTNLLSQSAVSAGSTLVVTVGSNSPQSITFGTGGGQVSTLAGLQTALAGLSNVTASVNQTNGNIQIAGSNLTDTIVIGGTANAGKFGIRT
ncbi:MAG: hypothetical protein ABUL48_02375, partial [Pseudorhodoplanes sp.]